MKSRNELTTPPPARLDRNVSENRAGEAVNIPSREKPWVQLPGDNYLLSECASEIGQHLSEQDIFRRGGTCFIVNERKDGFIPMSADILRSWMEDHLTCYKVRKLSGTDEAIRFRRTIPVTDAKGILVAPQFISQLREVERLNPIRVPVIDRWGHVKLLDEGHDEFTKSYTADAVPIISGMPLDMARAIIEEKLSEFVFADNGRSKAVAVAAMLTVFGRGLLPSRSLRPCFIVLANAEGAGKTLLVKCATVPVLGYVPAGSRPKDEDEMRKALLAAVIEAKPVIFFDNAKKHIASESLEGFLTTQDYEGRILGQSALFRGENNAVVFITGNHATVSPDMRRRSLFIELFLEAERAEDRTFKNLLEVPTLIRDRADILSALWSFIQHWDNQMRPSPTRSNSSFPEWSAIIGGIVGACGYGCPLESPKIEAAADRDNADMHELVKLLANGAKSMTVDFEDIINTAKARGLFEWVIPAEGELDRGAKSTFSKLLGTWNRRIIGNHRFFVEGKGKSRCYKVEVRS